LSGLGFLAPFLALATGKKPSRHRQQSERRVADLGRFPTRLVVFFMA
jgi:hypothetical protein